MQGKPSRQKDIILIIGEDKEGTLTKQLWLLLSNHNITFENAEWPDLERFFEDNIVLCLIKGDLKKAAKELKKFNLRDRFVCDLVYFSEAERQNERKWYHTLKEGFDYSFCVEDFKDSDFKHVLLKRIARAKQNLQKRTHESEYQKFKAFLSASKDAFIIFDNNKKLFFVSEHYKRAYPKNGHKLLKGLHVEEAYNLLSQENGVFPGDALYEEMKSFWHSLEGQAEFTLQNGLSMRMTASRLPDNQGTIISTTNITDYLDDKKKLETQSKKLKKALKKEKEASEVQKQFIRMISHEFKTPLSIVDGHAQALMRRNADKADEDLVKRLHIMRSAVSRLTQMMDGLMSFNISRTGKLQTFNESFDIKAMTKNICEEFSAISQIYGIKYSFRDVPDSVLSDKKVYMLILSNLLSNAIKYSKGDPVIKVILSYTEEEQMLSLLVEDKGIGIPETEIDKVFKRFYRASTGLKTSGTGIGLNIVKNMVDVCGGNINVSSVVGKGTSFTINIPVNQTKS